MELCDDDFEEHVLAYSPERTGLHLHGLNSNTPEFSTRPIEQVNEFAETWGLMPVRYLVFDTFEEVEAFAKKTAETGSLDGEPIEGFVVRTSMPSRDGPPPNGVVKPPYSPGQTWFYKIKFDEPYLMYRDWRELTRTMLRQKSDYDALQLTLLERQASQLQVSDTIPSETPPEENSSQNLLSGTLCVALADLFGWAHIQSDDIKAKRTGPMFLKTLEQALLKSDVVLADRNNHLLKHRDEIVDMVRRLSDPVKGKIGRVRLVALAWRVDGLPHSLVQQVCASRMTQRADRHQCLRTDPNEPFKYDAILTRFIKEIQTFQSVQEGEGTAGASDEQFDDHMWLDIEESFENVLDQTLERLCPLLELVKPSNEAKTHAIQKALTYRPSVIKDTPKVDDVPSSAVLSSSYLGVFVHIDVPAFVMQKLDELPPSDETASARSALKTILTEKRAISQPHLTLIHRQDVKRMLATEEQWQLLYNSAASKPEAPRFTMQVDGLAWNNSVMALHVAHAFSDTLEESSWSCIKKILHITVGLVSPNARAIEANNLWSGSSAQQLTWDPVSVSGHLALHSNPK
ncbi:RNA ligase (ATP) [Malassezia caprae]|uniref:RNA ligase (ATP) n=1 Tax=Malassezia caprae TaxID=1381934 RepID=A0AAF0E8Y1_9BASI|nr:RNA ligase (ATP) [Malassezia caprae]